MTAVWEYGLSRITCQHCGCLAAPYARNNDGSQCLPCFTARHWTALPLGQWIARERNGRLQWHRHGGVVWGSASRWRKHCDASLERHDSCGICEEP